SLISCFRYCSLPPLYLLVSLLSLTRRAPRSTLFPYTTLFRSKLTIVFSTSVSRSECRDRFCRNRSISEFNCSVDDRFEHFVPKGLNESTDDFFRMQCPGIDHGC